jgi:hypothetical protein
MTGTPLFDGSSAPALREDRLRETDSLPGTRQPHAIGGGVT